MKIVEIRAENYRLLKNTNLNVEKNLSVIIGKNNCGKTSLLTLLNKFLSGKPTSRTFQFEDFNLDFQKEFKEVVLKNKFENEVGLSLKIIIEYDDDDSLKNIHNLLLDLDPEKKHVVLSFEYKISQSDFNKLKKEFQFFKTKEDQKAKDKKTPCPSQEDILTEFLKKNYYNYFKPRRKSLPYSISQETNEIIIKGGNDLNFIDLDKEQIPIYNLINFQFISAKRSVSNDNKDKTLSGLASEYYEKTNPLDSENPTQGIENFRELLSITDKELNKAYDTIFNELIRQVTKFGGIQKGDSNIKIESSLQDRNLLTGNTTVTYNHDNKNSLPEHYNGLGYMNLISMILEIEVILYKFQKIEKDISNPADINLFFIEEPEAHTHPQMQYIFIKNIKDLLSTAQVDKKLNTLQTIISTHSSHITSESNFDDIKYFQKKDNSIIAKNLSSLKDSYINDGENGEKYFKFLKQYLTLHRSELFFADKAIFIEGDTERILLPAMMKKLDQEDENDETIPMLSQNISIIETGAHSHIFEIFIDFIGIKSLIITDIDSNGEWSETDANGNIKNKKGACQVDSEYALGTSNSAIKFFLKQMNWEEIKNSPIEKRKLSKKENEEKKLTWTQDPNGHILICYQTKESKYHARSFEDSFFHINKDFITDEEQPLDSLTTKWVKKFRNDEIKVYECVEKAVNSKPTLAMEILLNSKELEIEGKESLQYSNWKTPQYIKEGLKWLKQ